MNNWNPNSWRDFPIKQQPTYNDLEKLLEAYAEVLPLLVSADQNAQVKESLDCEPLKPLFKVR